MFICISLYIREMFRFKQISSHFSNPDVCFFRRRGGGFSAHANDTIILRLLTLTNSAPLAPLPTHPPTTGLSWFSGRVIGPRWHAWANDSTGAALGLYIAVLSVSTTTQCLFAPH